MQDLPETIERSRPNPSTLPVGVAERISFEGHDFFTQQPLKDVDVFLLRMIIHDWPDAEAVEILRNIVNCMKAGGGKIILMDTVLPAPGTTPKVAESALRVRDLAMMETHNSNERELEAWQGLLASVDKRLVIKQINQPLGSSMAILEVQRKDGVVNGHINGHTNGITSH